MRSKTVQRLMDEMENDPWYIKLKRWFNLQRWVLMCRTRWIWDLNYEHNIFKKLLTTKNK